MSLQALKVVEVSVLTKRVDNGGEPLIILHENSFDVAAGETVAIVGASGSGKSTLLGLLAGLDLPSSGLVVLAGESLGMLDEDARAVLRVVCWALSFSRSSCCRRSMPLKNVMLPLELAGQPTRAPKLSSGWNVLDSCIVWAIIRSIFPVASSNALHWRVLLHQNQNWCWRMSRLATSMRRLAIRLSS